jgi:ribosome-associated toxin RatA of RatAB toxin-antitoxin module
MAEQSTQTIVIDAPADRIMAVIADFPAYPEWTKAIKTTEVLETNDNGRATAVKMTVDQGPVKDTYTLGYDWAADNRSVRWHLIKGQMQKAQDGSYRLAPSGEGTEVTYTLAVQLAIPMIGQLRRKAEKVIMDTALKELKRRVESAG